MNPTSDAEKIINADPFAADIFASESATARQPETSNGETDETTKAILWSECLPRVSPRSARWDELFRNIPPVVFGELPRLLADALARLLDLENEKTIEFTPIAKRELNRAADFSPDDSYWLTLASGDAEIYLAFDDALAVALVDAAFDAKKLAETVVARPLTETEMSILEFFAVNLAGEANRFFGSPQTRFRTLDRQVPQSLRQIIHSESFSLFASEWQTAGALPPSSLKIYLASNALESMQNIGVLQTNARRFSADASANRVKNIRARIVCGSAELSFGELAALETGDVVLLENQWLQTRGEALSGRAEIFVGDGANRKIIGALKFSGGAGGAAFEETAAKADNKIAVRSVDLKSFSKIAVESFIEVEAPPIEKSMTETNDNLQGENAENEFADDAAGGGEQNGLAVENLVVALRVELEARRLTLAEVGNLRENQIVELGVKPTDEVNILIDERVVGRGELVALVDGGDNRLGVRITKLMR